MSKMVVSWGPRLGSGRGDVPYKDERKAPGVALANGSHLGFGRGDVPCKDERKVSEWC